MSGSASAHAHPFAQLIGLQVERCSAGASTLRLQLKPEHLNPNAMAHGAVLFALADTGMGAALVPALGEGEHCATVEIKINYFKPVRMGEGEGELRCESTLLHKGRRMANLESRLFVGEALVASANGNFAVLAARQ